MGDHYCILKSMKIVVTHSSPDMDAITSVWLVKKFLPNWNDAEVRFVPAGERLQGRGPVAPSSRPTSSVASSLRSLDGTPSSRATPSDPVEVIGGNEVIHVDTGLGPLDHHQTASDTVCGASLTWEFIRRQRTEDRKRTFGDGRQKTQKEKDKEEAVERMVKVVVDIDHFKEVFRKEALADYHEFDLASILDGIKLQFPNQDDYYVEFISKCLDAVLHEFENRIWAEKEIKENGIKFETREGIGMGFETINDSVVKLAQKMGYAIVARKDPRKGYVRIKVRPDSKIDLTLACEKLRKIDPDATWYLHVSRKMLLNGSVKNPKMRPTKLKIDEIIKVLEKI